MQKIPFTRKSLTDWAGAQVVRDAEAIVKQGLVLRADYDPPWISGAVLLNNREFPTRLRLLDDGHVENACTCYANRERGIICAHVIALGLTLVMRATDPAREARYKEELRRASRLARIDESAYLKRAPAGTPGAQPARLIIGLAAGWEQAVAAGAPVPLTIRIAVGKRSLPPEQVPSDQALTLDRFDTALLYVLEDIAEGPPGGELTVNARDFINILDLHKNRTLDCTGGEVLKVHASPVTTALRMDIAPETGELLLAAHTACSGLAAGREPHIIVAGGSAWAMGGNQAWPLDNVLPEPYHAVYTGPVPIARSDVMRFLNQELPLLERFAAVETDIAADLFSVDPAVPRFRLQLTGSPASLAGTLHAEYGDVSLIAGRPDAQEHFAIPDPEDPMRYTVRNREAEAAALALLADCGLRGETGSSIAPVVGEREVLNILGAAIPRLRRHGWKVELEGRVAPYFESMDFVAPVVKVDTDPDAGWFEVGFDYEDPGGASLSAIDVQRAIRRGDAWLESGGRRLLIDAPAVEAMLDVFGDCAAGEATEAGRFRLGNVYGPFVKGSLESLDGIDIEDTPLWREQAARMNRTARLEAVPLPAELTAILRPYQKEGVNWLRFMEGQGFGGILADEMGLGKTLQTLAWLQLERCRPASRGHPALIVCPTSLVENWAEEAARFTPGLRVLVISGTGTERSDQLDRLDQCDLAVTSYALLRRELDRLLQTEFSAAVLDEAQHIKNRSTQNARAAKQIRAGQRLVLTGTPVENSVADLWSIMDFLMPGYLGRHDDFRARYELPIARGDEEGADAQRRLRRKLHPFLLRRLKRDVAKDLPPKIERTTFCTLSPDQRVVYQGLLQKSRDRISGLVSQRGFAGARMEILTVLLRLRQACCHLDLLKLPDLKAAEPSAKLELFLELVDEAVDGGHRILVFSQFTSMLGILRKTLTSREIACCYLDGSTKNRMEEVHRFNRQREIPVFLISLKAGGTGLNLTGADMVIHFDPWWNPAVENQATDRAYRIGQKRTVYSNKLITRGTVEEKVLQMQARKQAVIDATIESDEAMLRAMNWEDVQSLLEL